MIYKHIVTRNIEVSRNIELNTNKLNVIIKNKCYNQN